MVNWTEFFSMGGYAFYVWGSYGAFALAIAAEIVAVRLRKRRVLAELIESRLAEKNEIET
jgi:heme exporter protein D